MPFPADRHDHHWRLLSQFFRSNFPPWLRDLAKSMLMALTTYYAGALFIGIAYLPIHWALMACCASIATAVAAGQALGGQKSDMSKPRTDVTLEPNHTIYVKLGRRARDP